MSERDVEQVARDRDTYQRFVRETLALSVAYPPHLRDTALESERAAFQACIRQAVERASAQYLADQRHVETMPHQLAERRRTAWTLMREWISGGTGR